MTSLASVSSTLNEVSGLVYWPKSAAALDDRLQNGFRTLKREAAFLHLRENRARNDTIP